MSRHHKALAVMSALVALLIVTTAPAISAPILIHGVLAFESGSGGMVDLAGERGFTLSAPVFHVFGPVFPGIPPGQMIDLGFSAQPLGGAMTLDGVLYSASLIFCDFPPFVDPGHTVRCGNTFMSIHGMTLAPPFNEDGGPVTIVAPVTFSADIYTVPPPFTSTFQHDTLVAADARAIFTLTPCLDSSCSFDHWNFDSIRYELDPVPEPATLLLWGTGAAGLGMARWLKRRRSRDSSRAA